MKVIDTYVEQGNHLVQDFSDITTYYTLSWGSRGDFATTDPFTSVRISDNKIILEYTVRDDPIWYIDFVKGLIYTNLRHFIEPHWSAWNFSTLVALLLIPTTQLSDSTKRRYLQQWLGQINPHNLIHKNYLHWSQIFLSYKRVAVLQLIHEFFESFDTTDNVELLFNQYLKQMNMTNYDEEDIAIISTAIKEQSMNVKQLQNRLSDLSTSQLYRRLSQLTFHVNEYLYHQSYAIGLVRLYFITNSDRVEYIRKQHFYENIDKFTDKEDVLVKYWFPVDQLDQLLGAVPNYPMLVQSPFRSKMWVSPAMFDTKISTWQSVHDKHSETIPLVFSAVREPRPVTQDELTVLKEIIQARTTDYRKLSVHFSHSKTKQIIRDLEQKQLFTTHVWWRRPAELVTALLKIPLTSWFDGVTSDHIYEHMNTSNTDKLNHLLEYSWPHLSSEENIEIRSSNQIRVILLVRISGTEDDITWIKETYSDQYVGTHDSAPGSHIIIPTRNFNNGWQIDIEQLANALTSPLNSLKQL